VLLERRIQEKMLDEAACAELEDNFAMRWPATPGQLTEAHAIELLAEAAGCVTGWESPPLSAEVLRHAPRLKIVAHSAGSVKHIVSEEAWKRGILVTNCAAENAVETAHYALALMVIASKNVLELANPATLAANWRTRQGHRPPDDFRGRCVGIIGAGHVGRALLRLLTYFQVRRMVYDPYLTAEQIWEIGAQKTDLEELLRRCDIVSLHAPALPETRHLMNAERLALMKDGAVLINASRGSLVDHAALEKCCRQRRIWAFLDVTDPEPPPPDWPLFNCPNVTITPHLGGAVGRGQKRLGRLAIEELKRFFAGLPPLFRVTRESLLRGA
jgi:phosphoglycerate dehydrogenase-like enzyme